MTSLLAVMLTAMLAAGPARQIAPRADIGGELSVVFDGLPRRDAAELRPRARLEAAVDLSPRLRLHADVIALGLAARRDGRTVRDLVVRPDDTWIELTTSRVDLRAGYGTVVWGRLDELQPTDVINPIDTARFLLEGRAAARLPVGFARARYFAADGLVLEGVVVPWFRRSTFDELAESSSPFNLVADQQDPDEAAGATGGGTADVRPFPLPFTHDEPPNAWSSVSGGGRATLTVGRADITASVFRGFDGFGPVTFERSVEPTPRPMPGPAPPGNTIPGRLVEHHERFTMVGGDIEAVAGAWVLRGEVAAFVDKQLAGVSRPGLVDGRVLEAGAGVERRTGRVRTYGLVVARRQWSDEDPRVERSDLSVVGSIERPFARERYLARVFGLVNPSDESGFVRALLVWDARDNVVVELSGAVFLGRGDDLVSRFSDRDFLLARLGYHF